MATLFIVEDDSGIMGKFVIRDYENATEAQVAAIDCAIEWFEDDEEADWVYDNEHIDNALAELNSFKEGVRDGQFDEEDECVVSGFTIKAL